MIDQKLKDYIKNKRAAGMNDHDIKVKLITVGWPEAMVNQGLLEDDEIPLPPTSNVPSYRSHL